MVCAKAKGSRRARSALRALPAAPRSRAPARGEPVRRRAAALGENIAALKREGLTILLSEQNLKFARRLADPAYIVEKGQIEFEGSFARLDADESVRRAYLSV